MSFPVEVYCNISYTFCKSQEGIREYFSDSFVYDNYGRVLYDVQSFDPDDST